MKAPVTRVNAWTGEIRIPSGHFALEGSLAIPAQAIGLVLFAHGCGSSRFSPRNGHVADILRRAGVATLLFDLLTKDEEHEEEFSGHLRFNIGLLAARLNQATGWATNDERTSGLPIGYFGASTGAAAALECAADNSAVVRAVVSRGGRPDLAKDALHRVRAPTLLIVGGDDDEVLSLNTSAMGELQCEKRLEIVPGATHLFAEHGALERVAELAAAWFENHLGE